MLNKVSLTGPDDRTPIAALNALGARFPFVEWALLYVAHNEGAPRNPTQAWREAFFDAAPAGHSAVHLCGSLAFQQLLAGSLPREILRAKRLQLNMTLFWSGAEPFSNWYLRDFEYQGVTFNCSEQFLVHAKAILFRDTVTARRILVEKSPRKQKALGRQVQGFNKAGWDARCEDLLMPALVAKFEQDRTAYRLMMASVGTELVEASPKDTLWGIGLSECDPRVLDRTQWRGENRLGRVLMRARDVLVEKKAVEPRNGELF